MRFRRSYPSSHCTTGFRHGSILAIVAALSALNAASQVPAVRGQEGVSGVLPSLEPPRQMAESTDAADKSILSRGPAAKPVPVVNRYKSNSPDNAVDTTAPTDIPLISDPAFAGPEREYEVTYTDRPPAAPSESFGSTSAFTTNYLPGSTAPAGVPRATPYVQRGPRFVQGAPIGLRGSPSYAQSSSTYVQHSPPFNQAPLALVSGSPTYIQAALPSAQTLQRRMPERQLGSAQQIQMQPATTFVAARTSDASHLQTPVDVRAFSAVPEVPNYVYQIEPPREIQGEFNRSPLGPSPPVPSVARGIAPDPTRTQVLVSPNHQMDTRSAAIPIAPTHSQHSQLARSNQNPTQQLSAPIVGGTLDHSQNHRLRASSAAPPNYYGPRQPLPTVRNRQLDRYPLPQFQPDGI